MKNAIHILAAAVLLTVITTAVTTCSGCESFKTADMEPKIEQMLAYISAGDSEAAYSMMYPNSVGKEAFIENFGMIRETYPVPREHTLSMITYRSSVGVGIGYGKTFTGEYSIDSAGERFRLTFVWEESNFAEGFRSFNIIMETDLANTD